MNTQENRTAIQFARATAVFLVLVVMGYAISTQVESAVDAKPAATMGVARDASATSYFPAQYMNQGATVGDHIQAY